MLALLGFAIVVLDIMALVTIVRSAMSVGGKVLWGLLVVVLPVGGTPLYCAFGQQTSRGLRRRQGVGTTAQPHHRHHKSHGGGHRARQHPADGRVTCAGDA